LNACALNGFAPPTVKEFRRIIHAITDGEMSKAPSLSVHTISNIDPTRAPPGKATMTVWRLAPYKLTDRSWDDYKGQAEEETLAMVETLLPSVKGKVIAKTLETPLDFERYSLSFQGGDVSGISTQLFQSQGHRPTPSLAQYAVPGAGGLYLAGCFMHPVAGGVTGGGRATAVKIFADNGWNFDKVTK
jgi:phytoene dehydrogenase-like protein